MSKKNQKVIKHKVNEKDLEINEGALEQGGVKKGDVIDFPITDEEMAIVTAKQNTFLADGTFVKAGEKVEVAREYAERLKKETNKFK